MDRRVMLVRPRNRDVYYLPGGKIMPGENDHEALVREIREELDVELAEESISHYGTFENQAVGEPPGMTVRIRCFTANVLGTPAPSREIAALDMFTCAGYLGMVQTAPAVRDVVLDLQSAGIID